MDSSLKQYSCAANAQSLSRPTLIARVGRFRALRDNLLVDYYEDPYAPGLYRHETNRYPYVEVTLDGETFHACAQGWKGDLVMIDRITNQLGWVDNGARTTLWVPASSCARIRREDSTWITTDDDHDWHENKDQKIDYRPSTVRD